MCLLIVIVSPGGFKGHNGQKFNLKGLKNVVGLYKIPIKNTKFYLQIFYFTINPMLNIARNTWIV